MKLAYLAEMIINRRDLKNDNSKTVMGNNAADMTTLLSKLRDTKDLDGKKAIAHQMAANFKVGGRDAFKANVDKCKTPGEVDKLAYNAALKGEGKGVK